MVLSYNNLSEFFHEDSTLNAHALNSWHNFGAYSQTQPKCDNHDSRYTQPTFILDRYQSDSESDDEIDIQLSLFDLPTELFYNCILPQMSLVDLQALYCTSHYARSLVSMSQDWDTRYVDDFNDTVKLTGSGFPRYLQRAQAKCMISGIVKKGSKLAHVALTSDCDQDIVQMRTNQHPHKAWMSPFIPLRSMGPIRTIATTDLALTGDLRVSRIGEKVEPLESIYNERIVQLEASLARNSNGQLFRVMFDEAREVRCLTLVPLNLHHYIYNFCCIKNRVYALARGIGLISWESREEHARASNFIEVNFTTILDNDSEFTSFAVYEHSYGTDVDVALTTATGVLTFQFDKSSSKVGMRRNLTDCNVHSTRPYKVLYYEEATFLVLCDDYVYRLKNNILSAVASLSNIADIVVSKQGFCMALTHDGQVYFWDCRTRREIATWAVGAFVKGMRVPIANPLMAQLDGKAISISCDENLAFALVA